VETFIVPKLRQSVQEVLDNALKGRGTSNYELEFRTKSDEIRYLLVNATTRRDAENNIVGVVGVAQDVTEAAKHDRAVAAMANELRQLIDTANAPIFGIDVDGDVNEWYVSLDGRMQSLIRLSLDGLTNLFTFETGTTKLQKSRDSQKKRHLIVLW
jgi:PAS domain-containing protein